MKTTTARRYAGVAALTMSLSLGLSACGGSDDDSQATDDMGSSQSAGASDSAGDMQTDDMASDDMASDGADATAATYGPACSQLPASGAGSLDGMATAPVANAASANPLLTTLVTAVKKAGLVDTLNGAEGLTVFAPTNDAFAAVPKKDLDALLADKKMLTTVLTHHVVEGRMAPDQLTGDLTTLAGDTVTINGSGEQATVGSAEKASVLCGNVPTANATVYVIDKVLMPTG